MDEITAHESKAKFAEHCERYEEMVKIMNKLVELVYSDDSSDEFSDDQRNLLSVAYKNVVGARRSSWRILLSLEAKSDEGTKENEMIKEYKKEIEKELTDICNDVLKLLDEKLVPRSKNQGQVFYLKMKGDYYRYLCEVKTGDDKKDVQEKASEAYKSALDIANAELPSTHPIRLGLALNFSVFYYEIASSPKKACELAKKAFDDAIADLDSLQEANYKDSTLIMQLLRDNLTLWTSEDQDADNDNENS